MTVGLRTSSHWKGNASAPYQNNDSILSEVFNEVQSESRNRSWAGSFANAYNNIPKGVTDSGTRVGAIGWAVSVSIDGFRHDGRLATQIGLHGTAGFQAGGSGPSAVIDSATGVRGEVYNDSEGATIASAKAGAFVSKAATGVVQNNTAVYAEAVNGTATNYSFYGQAGKLYNSDQIVARNVGAGQSESSVSARRAGNSYEFGHTDGNGYGSNIGATWSSGQPFVAFCAEADQVGNTFTTRGKRGTVITTDLAGELVFSRLLQAAAAGQAPTESARFDSNGHLVLAETPKLKSGTPDGPSAPGEKGEVCWDEDHVYVCVAENSWKRVALSNW